MNLFRRILIAGIEITRPFLGSANVCIYEQDISCGNFAIQLLAKAPLYQAVPKICWRILTCNPITAIILKLRFYLATRNITLLKK